MAEMRQAIGEESVKIAAARKRFWETYPDKPGRASAPIVSGEETIEINGKSFATRWQAKSYTYDETASNKGCSLVVKVWTSDSVPTGLVKKLDDVTCPKPTFGQVPRFMIETYLDSFEGFTPVASK
jgi:hypothetical protein